MAIERKIILGSKSPRRNELLREIIPSFTVDTENSFVESKDPAIPPHELPSVMSEGKSLGFHRPLEPDEILITADTVVIVDNRLLGKPKDRQDAVDMLKALSGRTHEVVTSVTIRSNAGKKTFTDTAYVTFKILTDNEINYYIDTCRPYDKAGAYGIQEWIGYIGITEIKGSYYTVMGLPVHIVYDALNGNYGF